MTLKAQILICIVLVIALLAIVNMVRKRSLELKYVLVWIGCDLILFIFTLFPNLMQKLANVLGIYSPVNMIFFLGFVLSLVIIFTLTVALSRVTARVRKLAQMIALQEDENKSFNFDVKRNKTSEKCLHMLSKAFYLFLRWSMSIFPYPLRMMIL